MVGLATAQMVFPSVRFAWTEESSDLPGIFYHPLYLAGTIAYGLLIIFILLHTDLTIDERFSTPNPAVQLSRILGITGTFLVFGQSLFRLVTLDVAFHITIYAIGRFILVFGVTLFLYAIYDEPREILAISRGITNAFFRDQVSIALFGFRGGGPEIIQFKGFGFFNNQNRFEQNLLTLGLAGLVVLARGDEYLEGSTLIPVIEDKEYTGFSICGWVKDKNQPDERFDGKNYIAVLIVVERNYEWLFQNRQEWEEAFLTKFHQLEDFSALKFDELIEFVKELMMTSAMKATKG